MKTQIGSEIVISNPPQSFIKWCEKNLKVLNSEYYKKKNMGFYTGNISKTIALYKVKNNNKQIILPFGLLRRIMPVVNQGEIELFFAKERNFMPPSEEKFALFDYQKTAVDALERAKFGILESKAGSGKTRMGLALAARLHCKTLWLTHTKDLLNQSMKAASEFFDESGFGTITNGKVNIGSTLTFATVQTLAKQDLSALTYEWDCIIVDECHRVCGTPEQLMQFSRVLNSLSCKHKYGLTATLHRSDGMVKSVLAYIGPVVHRVPDSAVKGKNILDVIIQPVFTNAELTNDCFKTKEEMRKRTQAQYRRPTASAPIPCDNEPRTPDFLRITDVLWQDQKRNKLIIEKLIGNKEHHNLILSTRISHLELLFDMLPNELQKQAVLVTGNTNSKKALRERENALDSMRSGEKKFLFATYTLAKEGLDIPILDRAYLTIPQTDYSVVIQSAGRIARVFPNKTNPICYDFVDVEKQYLFSSFLENCLHITYGFAKGNLPSTISLKDKYSRVAKSYGFIGRFTLTRKRTDPNVKAFVCRKKDYLLTKFDMRCRHYTAYGFPIQRFSTKDNPLSNAQTQATE